MRWMVLFQPPPSALPASHRLVPAVISFTCRFMMLLVGFSRPHACSRTTCTPTLSWKQPFCCFLPATLVQSLQNTKSMLLSELGKTSLFECFKLIKVHSSGCECWEESECQCPVTELCEVIKKFFIILRLLFQPEVTKSDLCPIVSTPA